MDVVLLHVTLQNYQIVRNSNHNITHSFISSCVYTWDGNIFAAIKTIIKPTGNLYKPIYGCPICMTPYWGTIVYFIFMNNGHIKDYFLTVGTAAGIAVIWFLLIDIKDAITK